MVTGVWVAGGVALLCVVVVASLASDHSAAQGHPGLGAAPAPVIAIGPAPRVRLRRQGFQP
jgi:hypothetical protein